MELSLCKVHKVIVTGTRLSLSRALALKECGARGHQVQWAIGGR